MASFQIFFISTFFFVLNTASSAKICKTTHCDDLFRFPWVKFPFQLNTTSQNKRCGYPGFNLSCNNRSQTILTLPHSGDFVVQGISYSEQSMNIDDPDGCFPRRFLTQNFTLSGSPFQLSETSKNYTFYNCSKETIYKRARRVSCLSGDNFTVWKTSSPFTELQQQCRVILNAPIEVQLTWFEPNCVYCVYGVEECAFKSDTGLEVGCFNVASTAPTPPTPSTGGMFTCFIKIAFPYFFSFRLLLKVDSFKKKYIHKTIGLSLS